MAQARPCVYLVPYDEVPEARRENLRPAARTGGFPALPDGVNRSDGKEPLVLSVDCAALPHGALDIELPVDGQLLFFTEIEYPPESSEVLHIPAAAVRTTERFATCQLDGEDAQSRVYEPRTLYPVTGLTFDSEWQGGPQTSTLDGFEEAVLDLAFGGPRPGVCVRIGGYSDPWDMAPDVDGLVLLAQFAGQAIDYDVFTMNLIVGTREDIAAGRYAGLRYEQQC